MQLELLQKARLVPQSKPARNPGSLQHGGDNRRMTHPTHDLHVYLRTVHADERTSLSVLAEHIQPNSTLLDLGCGSGALGKYLTEKKSCVCDGLTWSEAEAMHARPHYRSVVVDNLETSDLLFRFPGQQYDYIVCADVLEHLSRPERIVDTCRSLLAPGGKLLISVPNAAYSGLIAELMQGEFQYREEGLLDRTHLRFFTRRSLHRFIHENKWQLEHLETIERDLPASEFQSRFDNFPPAVSRYLLNTPDALTYQFIGVASPMTQSTAAELHEPPLSTAQATFSAQLYLGRDGQYSENDKLLASGLIGSPRQTLRFPLRKGNGAPISALRLDPADRPGFMHLYRLALEDEKGHIYWEWTTKASDKSLLAQTEHQQMVWSVPAPVAADATMVLLTGDDPWFQVPAPIDSLLETQQQTGGLLVVELGWPMSADYLVLSNTVRPLQDKAAQLATDVRQYQSLVDRISQTLHSREAALAESQRQLNETTSRLEELNERFIEADSQLQRTSSLLAYAQDTNVELSSHRQELMAHRQELLQACQRQQTEYENLAAHLRSIENSTVFKATRPIVHAKMRIDRLLGRGAMAPLPHTGPQPVEPQPHPVDIIVPVYKGLADTKLCIDSALASPCNTPFRLVVINDASPEPEVTSWLRERASQEPRILLLENEVNLGFVGTVNRGMALSDTNDVLLLNSDTEVANDWLDKIRRAAYADQRVGSVTPFSNNATICSYPQFCKDNELPDDYDTARMDKLCAQTNPGAVVDVPTGVGFCMYIRRACLEAVGLFDTANFGKGYGEENDFCQRAQAAGWRNLHLLDTFVLHTGGVSFGASKSPREQAAMETLRRLHPRYESQVMAFVQADPARTYRIAMDIARIRDSGKAKVLAIVHDREGGTLRHIHELALHLHDRVITLMLTPIPGGRVRLKWAVAQEPMALEFDIPSQMEQLENVLRKMGVQHLHYHHLLGHHPAIKQLPTLLGVRYDFTAHDYYSYCSRISLTDNSNRYVKEPGPGKCGCCPPHSAAPDGRTMEQWRADQRVFLERARYVIAPSRDTAQRMAAFAPGANVLAVRHTDMGEHIPSPYVAPIAETARLKVAVIGALSTIKGADVLEATALQAARTDAPMDFHLLGYAYRSLITQPKARLTVHGAYAEADLPELLAWLKPDVIWFPAQWPETYSYTLSAALQAGSAIVAPDIGAFAERLENREWSWVEPWDQTADEWLAFFTRIRKEHFVANQPPAPPTPAMAHNNSSSNLGDQWAYTSNYLTDIAPAPTAPQRLSLDFLQAHLPAQTASQETRSRALQVLVWLRSLPLLRGVARAIPRHWQTQVKNWLRA